MQNNKPETLKKIIADATHLSPTSISITLRPPLDYQSNRLFDVQAGSHTLIAKEYLKSEELHDAPRREFQALKLLAPLDIAPQPVHFQPQTTPSLGPVVIYEFMQGRMWNRHSPTPVELTHLAETWLKMNDVSKDNLWLSRNYERPLQEAETQIRAEFQTFAAWAEAEFRPAQKAAGLCLSLLESRHNIVDELADCTPPLCFCRADPRFANVIHRPDGRLGWVDWEDAGLRDPARDLADIITHPNQEDLVSYQQWQAFLQPYLAIRSKFDADLARRMQLYLAIFPIFWLAILIGQGIHRAGRGKLPDWTPNELPANLRLRRYLARGLAWPEKDFSCQLDSFSEIAFFPDAKVG